jgi:hypothetical protein
VPVTAELMMLKSPLYGHFDDTDALYKEVMDKSDELSKKK